MASDLGGRQKRPLNGLTNGAPTAVAVSPATTTVHTLDDSDAENGGPYTDELTLYIINKSGVARICLVLLDGVTVWEGSIPATTALNATQIFDGQPFRDAGGVITVQAPAAAGAADIYCWGWFVRG